MLISTVKKIFGTRNDRELKRMRKVVARINALEEAMQATIQYSDSGWSQGGCLPSNVLYPGSNERSGSRDRCACSRDRL